MTKSIRGILVRRYKRFLADVRLPNGKPVTVHCPNPGAMLGLNEPGSPVILSDHKGSKRKLRYGLEAVRAKALPPSHPSPPPGERAIRRGIWVGVNTGKANNLAEGILRAGRIRELRNFTEIQREVVVSKETRLDFRLARYSLLATRYCFLEVKSVTLARGNTAYFPDSVTERGTKHLRELMKLRLSPPPPLRGRGRTRAALLFIVQRADVRAVRPADDIDPEYGKALRAAAKAGVELYAYRFKLTATRILPDRRIPVELQ